MREGKLRKALMVAAFGCLAAVAIPAQNASAATVNIYSDQNCTHVGAVDCYDYLQLYYNSGEAGASANFMQSVPTYSGYGYYQGSDFYNVTYVFTGGNGSGQAVKNNAASAFDESGVYNFNVYYNSDYQGAVQSIGIQQSLNLNATLKNENASQKQYNAF